MRDRKSPDERRAQILDAARKLCAKHGYAAVQIRDLMRETNLSRGGFYHHFSRKADVLKALIESEVVALVESAGNDLPSLIRHGSVYANGSVGILDTITEPNDLADYIQFLEVAHETHIGPMVVRAIEAGISKGQFQEVNSNHLSEIFLAVNARSNRNTLNGVWDEKESIAFAETALSIFAASLGAPNLFFDLKQRSPHERDDSK